ncbi:MAG: hypothetical protein ACHQ2Y_04485 [Candidatus Lutacidiplasmatales archaeon]
MRGPLAADARSRAHRDERRPEGECHRRGTSRLAPPRPRARGLGGALPRGGGDRAPGRIALSNSPSGPLVLVGHAPTLPQLAALALPDSGDLPFPLGRAAAALIDFPGPVAPGRALPLWAYSREELIDYGEAHGAARKGAAPTSRS